MDKFCKNCGAKLEEGVKFCANCGSKVEEEQKTPVVVTVNVEKGSSRNTAGIQERSIAWSIVWSILTCGIYGLYWMYKLNDELNQLTDDTSAAGGGTVIVLTIVTCGIYGLYWFYKMGDKVDALKGTSSNNNILFMVLAFFQLSIVNYAIMQDTINMELKK